MNTSAKTVEQKSAITVKQAVARAMAAAREFYSGQGIADITLEELEMSNDDRHWLITLGFYLPSKKPAATEWEETLRQIQGKTYEKRYKLFEVDARTGKVGAMKIRTV